MSSIISSLIKSEQQEIISFCVALERKVALQSAVEKCSLRISSLLSILKSKSAWKLPQSSVSWYWESSLWAQKEKFRWANNITLFIIEDNFILFLWMFSLILTLNVNSTTVINLIYRLHLIIHNIQKVLHRYKGCLINFTIGFMAFKFLVSRGPVGYGAWHQLVKLWWVLTDAVAKKNTS